MQKLTVNIVIQKEGGADIVEMAQLVWNNRPNVVINDLKTKILEGISLATKFVGVQDEDEKMEADTP